jgi:CheY-like chemotaxis protein
MKSVKMILIVDDDEVSSYLLKVTLQELAITDKVTTVYNGKQALDYLENTLAIRSTPQPEEGTTLILLDLNMPVMNGFEFLDEFMANYEYILNKVSICILTSSVSPKDISRAGRYNIAGFITKPLTPENLLPILEKES